MGSCKTGGETNEEGICDVKTGIDLFIHFCHIYLFGEERRTRVRACTWKSEDNLKKPVLSFYHVSPKG